MLPFSCPPLKILLTGAAGCIGQRLLPVLAAAGHGIICLVRNTRRFALPDTLPPSQHAQGQVVPSNLL